MRTYVIQSAAGLKATITPAFSTLESFTFLIGRHSAHYGIKRKACGYRNRKRFHNAIYFHLADLDLYPESLRSTHTNA